MVDGANRRPGGADEAVSCKTKQVIVGIGASAGGVRRLQITDDEISSAKFDELRGHRAPIDLFFRSLAERHGDRFGIIPTGAIGMRAAKDEGGALLVQDPSEAEHPSMPRNAIETGIVDFVLPLAELATCLVDLIRTKHTVVGGSDRLSRENGTPDIGAEVASW